MDIKLNDYTVSLDALKAANWEEVDSGNSTTWQRDDYNDHAIIAIQASDECWWDGIEADHISAIGADGKPCEISISLDKCDDDSSHIYINGTEECGHAETDDEDYYAADIARLMGHVIGGKMRLDYEEAADDFLREHPGYIYVMDNARGFANEWTIFACASEDEAKEIERLYEDTTRYDAETVRPWLISAMQTAEDYKADHAATKCCGLIYATDDPNYGTPEEED